jgi:hypothetical protein
VRRLVFLGAYVLLSLYVFLTWLGLDMGLRVRHGSLNETRRASFHGMVYGDGYKPYVRRTLLPTTIRLVAAACPAGCRERLEKAVLRRPVPRLIAQLGWERQLLLEYLLAMVLIYGCLLGFVFALRDFLGDLSETHPLVKDVAPLVALLLLPFLSGEYHRWGEYGHYIYDFSTLFLFTLGLRLLAAARWTAFLIVYFVACLNKETTILLTLVFVLHYARSSALPRPRFWKLLSAQLLFFGAVQLGLVWAFRKNRGEAVEFHLLDHNLALFRPIPFAALALCLALGVLLALHWRRKPRFLKDALWILAPLVGLTVFLGYLDELRDYYEAFPAVFLLAYQSVVSLLGVRIESRSP